MTPDSQAKRGAGCDPGVANGVPVLPRQDHACVNCSFNQIIWMGIEEETH